MQRLYYSISDVASLIDEETHVLRYWEKEFPQIAPKKNRSGKRVYSSRDVDMLKIIKKLLREDKLSIQGAKDHFNKFNLSNPDENLFDDEVFINDKIENKPNINDKAITSLYKIRNKLEKLIDQINAI